MKKIMNCDTNNITTYYETTTQQWYAEDDFGHRGEGHTVQEAKAELARKQ